MNASRIMEIAHKYATIQREAINVHVALATYSQQTVEPALVRTSIDCVSNYLLFLERHQ